MNQQKTKKCPFCKKKTSRNIDTCPHCKRIFVEKIGKNRPTKDYYQEVAKTNFSYQFNEEPASRAISFKFVLVVLFVIFLVYSFLFGEDDSSNINSTTTNGSYAI